MIRVALVLAAAFALGCFSRTPLQLLLAVAVSAAAAFLVFAVEFA